MKRLLVVLLAACAPLAAQTAHPQNHPPQNVHEYARALDDPAREAWQKPDEVIRALALRPDELVADIGAGTGYFARRMARHAAKVYAVDIDTKLLEKIRQGALESLQTILAAPDDPNLPPASVDTLFFCNVLHHIENRPAYYPKLAQALKPGGRIVIIEFFKRKLPVGPPESMKLTEQEVIHELKAAGFAKTKSFDFLPYQYFFVFERQGADH